MPNVIFVSGLETDKTYLQQAQIFQKGYGSTASIEAYSYQTKIGTILAAIDRTPGIPIVLFSAGCQYTKPIAEHLKKKNIPLNLLHVNEPYTKSSNVYNGIMAAISIGLPASNVYSGGSSVTGSDIAGATSLKSRGRTNHMQSLEILGRLVFEISGNRMTAGTPNSPGVTSGVPNQGVASTPQPVQFKSPISLDPKIQQDLQELINAATAQVDGIAQNYYNTVMSQAQVTPRVNLQTVAQLVNRIAIPRIQAWEGGWVDHPKDPNGSTMRGITVGTFRNTFDDIFIAHGTPTVKTAAERFNTAQPNWKKDSAVTKQVLYLMCNNAKIAGLWIVKFLCDQNCRYPMAVMSEDAFLGFLLLECCWMSGPGCYGSNGFDDVARNYGWNGQATEWAKFCSSLGNKTPAFASELLKKRLDYLLNISQPGSTDAQFRTGWVDRLVVNETKSTVSTLIVINELYNSNTSGVFTFTAEELAYTRAKAESYKTFTINTPV